MSDEKLYDGNPDGVGDFEEEFTCAGCKKNYSYYRTLRRHVHKAHPGEELELAPPRKHCKAFKYKCDQCPRQYNSVYNLRSHERNVHGKDNRDVQFVEQTLHKCSLCDFRATKKDMPAHFEGVHGVELDTKRLEFDTYDDFMLWKEEFEKETESKFVKTRGDKVIKSTKRQFFVCHRSGHFTSKGSGERLIKAQGSNKIDGYCPARINVTLEDPKCTVEVISSHVGHTNDLGHLFLTASERSSIAAKIAAKIPFEAILDEVYESIPESGMKRIHLITRKDLHNIGNSLNLRGPPPLSLAERKDEIKRKFICTIDNLQNPEQVEFLEQMHTDLGPTLEAVYSAADCSSNLESVHHTSIPRNRRRIQPRQKSARKAKRSVIVKPEVE